MKEFKGRVIVPGTCSAEALVSHNGFNTLASFQMAIMFNKKGVPCGDQNNPDINGQKMQGKALCLPMTIGSTTGGMILYAVLALGKPPPACCSPSPSTRWPPPAPSWRTCGPTRTCLWLTGSVRISSIT